MDVGAAVVCGVSSGASVRLALSMIGDDTGALVGDNDGELVGGGEDIDDGETVGARLGVAALPIGGAVGMAVEYGVAEGALLGNDGTDEG